MATAGSPALLACIAAACLIIGTTACGQPYTVECVGPGEDALPVECDAVARAAVEAGQLPRHVGDLVLVVVEEAPCDRLARAGLQQALDASEHDKCWGVRMEFEGSGLGRLVARHRFTGELGVFR